MAAGAAMAVVGWWTGYKLGGVIALNLQQNILKIWVLPIIGKQLLIVLGVVIILMNIGLMFV